MKYRDHEKGIKRLNEDHARSAQLMRQKHAQEMRALQQRIDWLESKLRAARTGGLIGPGDALVGDDAVCAACREASEAPASCYVCDAAAWQHDHLGPLCPSHFAAVEEPASVGLSLDIEQPRELFYQLWHDQSYTTKAPPGATFTAEVCAACQDLLSHVPFSKPGSYRLFAYCERCNKAVEL